MQDFLEEAETWSGGTGFHTDYIHGVSAGRVLFSLDKTIIKRVNGELYNAAENHFLEHIHESYFDTAFLFARDLKIFASDKDVRNVAEGDGELLQTCKNLLQQNEDSQTTAIQTLALRRLAMAVSIGINERNMHPEFAEEVPDEPRPNKAQPSQPLTPRKEYR